jgi:transposase-like protein
MRYSASEKFEIIELVEQSSLSIRRTLTSIGIPRSTFYDWYSRYQEGGIEALEDGKPRPRRIWNKIPDKIGTAIVNLALEEPDLATCFLWWIRAYAFTAYMACVWRTPRSCRSSSTPTPTYPPPVLRSRSTSPLSGLNWNSKRGLPLHRLYQTARTVAWCIARLAHSDSMTNGLGMSSGASEEHGGFRT